MKSFKKSQVSEQKKMLKQGLLGEDDYEGGGLSKDALSKLNAINGSTYRKSSVKSASEETEIHGLKQFGKHSHLFQDLTKRTFCDTRLDVVSIIITYDSKFAIAIVNDKDEHFELQGYSLTTFTQVWVKEYKGEYLKMNLVEQNAAGNIFAIAAQDNGKFFVSIVDNTGKELDHLNVSSSLALDDHSKPITGFWEPIMTCAFIPDDNLYVSCYHRKQHKQYHFTYSYKTKSLISGITVTEIKDCTPRNFPIKSFYSEVTGNCHTFYRQGQGFTVSASNPDICKYEKLTDSDLGNMYLVYDQCLVTRSSNSILFFKIDKETGKWKQFTQLDNIRGQIYFIKGNVRIQVTTDEKVYFYIIDKETFMPNLENVMYNFMQCSQTMFGTRVRFGITYKTNQPGFQIFTRSSYHNFKVTINGQNFEGAEGINLATMHAYIMADHTKVGIYNDTTFELIQSWNVPAQDESIHILYMTISKDEKKIALALGKTIIKDHKKISEIVIYQKNRDGKFELEKLRDIEFTDACHHFVFNNKNSQELLFFTSHELFKLDYLDEGKDREVVYTLENSLSDTPIFGVFSKDQSKFMVTSHMDILYVDMNQKNSREIDFDHRENISAIQNILANDTHFFILANKKDHKLGFYLFSIEIDNPEKEAVYYINWNNKLDIGNVDLQFLHEKQKDGTVADCIVVSYKCIGINTFNVFVIDINTKLIKYWHESYQLWESPIKGFLLNTNDFLILSKTGINLLALGEKPSRIVKDFDGLDRMIHSLGMCNFLKIEPTNHLLFACQFYEDRQICIQEQYEDHEQQTHYDDIYRVKIHEPTLRELMFMQSVYACKTQSDVSNLVDKQPNPSIFFKVFLELGVKSMMPYLAFDSNSIKHLLSSKNEAYFTNKFPLFYKNEDGQTAIDQALDMNQIRSINLMINYICKYQDNYVYSHLFEHNLVELINKGVEMLNLFNSNIFNRTFDFDEWPATNADTTKQLAPYNKSIFKLRFEYPAVFRKIWKIDDEKSIQADQGKFDLNEEKVFKIKYILNILPSVSEDNGQLMNAIAGSEELEIFKTDLIKDLIDYKWNTYAQAQHRFGAIIHMTYVVVLMYYISKIFLQESKYDAQGIRINPDPDNFLLVIIMGCLVYPLLYDGTQMLKQGADYLSDSWNYLDMIHISLGYYNVYCQWSQGTWELKSKITMIVVILVCLMKTFFFMRIVKSFSYIVTMIIQVVGDLKVFLLFFSILIVMFSAVFDVIAMNDAKEYKYLGPFMGNVMTTLRLSLGDFDFGVLEGDTLNVKQHWLFWIIWVIMVIFSALIFLNFIIAEVSNSYQRIKQQIDSLIYKERAELIEEAEDIMSSRTKKNDKTKFPKYIVVRELED